MSTRTTSSAPLNEIARSRPYSRIASARMSRGSRPAYSAAVAERVLGSSAIGSPGMSAARWGEQGFLCHVYRRTDGLATTTPAVGRPATQIGVSTRASYLLAPSERATARPVRPLQGSRLHWRVGRRRRRPPAPRAGGVLDTRGRINPDPRLKPPQQEGVACALKRY